MKLPVGPEKVAMIVTEGSLTESQLLHLRNISRRPGFQYFCDHLDGPRIKRSSVDIYFYQNNRLHLEKVSPHGKILSSSVSGLARK